MRNNMEHTFQAWLGIAIAGFREFGQFCIAGSQAEHSSFRGAGGGGRTRTELSLQRILSPLRMPFRHLWLAKTQKPPESLEFLDRPPLNGAAYLSPRDPSSRAYVYPPHGPTGITGRNRKDQRTFGRTCSGSFYLPFRPALFHRFGQPLSACGRESPPSLWRCSLR
jgi:hypothetical protein